MTNGGVEPLQSAKITLKGHKGEDIPGLVHVSLTDRLVVSARRVYLSYTDFQAQVSVMYPRHTFAYSTSPSHWRAAGTILDTEREG